MEQLGVLFSEIINFIFTITIYFTLFSGFVAVSWIVVSKLMFKSKINKALKGGNKSFLLIKTSQSNQQKEEAMEEFLKSFHRVVPTGTSLNLEMASSDQFLYFYIVVDKNYKSIVESQLYAQYPEAEIEEIEDYLPSFDKNTAFAQFNFKRSSFSPIKTYQGLEDDFLKSLSSMLSKTEPREKAYLQLSLQRVGSKFWERGLKSLNYKYFGRKFDNEGNPSNSYIKFSQDLYRGKFLVAYTAQNEPVAKAKLNTLLGLFKSLKSENEIRKKKYFIFGNDLAQIFKARVFEKGDYWSPSEIATLYHFPYQGSIVSNIVNTTSKRAPAPDVLPAKGLVNEQEVSFFGETNYRNGGKVFGIKRIDRRRHLYVVGKTGTGKSRLLELLLISDIQSGQGCCLLDPHGDLADELLMFVPKERIDDVVYVNPADRDFPIGFNPLEPVLDYEVRQHLSTFFISIFKKLFAASWNPRMEHIVRYITLALLETPDSNILGIQRMLSDTPFRQRVIKQIQDPVVKSFWVNEFSAWNERFANDAVIPILNKVGQFIANPIIRNMIGQRNNSLKFEEFMNEGKIVLINASKGKLGDDNAALLGAMFITKIQQAALARAKMKEEDRRDFYFYVDEFQNFATDAFSTILSEARKYHLNLTIAHQYIAQLPEDVKATAFGNVGSLIVFPIGGDDAAYLQKEFSPVFSADDMINLNVREMYIKMSVNGKITPPFSAKTLNVPKPTFDYSVEILNNSRMKFGKNRTAVENEIARWTQSVDPIDGPSTSPEESFPEPII
ncbi:DUF87 domain-containing protein [Candidatus Parcubacteria bacterium]|nr:MAG: DUF87 domain-containing protein [Candidatus Parcubacteria bacterium]